MATRGTKSAGVQGPEHAIPVMTALDLYTSGSAQLNHEANWRGTIAPGKAADLVAYPVAPVAVPPEELEELRPALTVVAGRATHDPDGRFGS